MARIYWDKFFKASVTLANSQREKLIPVERYDLMYDFYFGLTIFDRAANVAIVELV